MTNLMQVNKQWSLRPDDERFVNLKDLHAFCQNQRDLTKQAVINTRELDFIPLENDIIATRGAGKGVSMSHHAFNQISTLASAPPSYLRKLTPELAAQCLNHGLRANAPARDIGIKVLTDHDGAPQVLRCATGPDYGTIWNSDVTAELVKRFDGSDFTVPGIKGKALDEVTKENTTLYAGDRDMFVFLADETNRIEITNRRDGQPGSMARGFFVWNSEVGDKTCGIGFFLFDYVCQNRIVWGAEQYKEVKIRHTSGAPDRWLDEIMPVIAQYSQDSTELVAKQLVAAQNAKIPYMGKFLSERFTKSQINGFEKAFEQDEKRPMETIWDVVTGMTAYARGLTNADNRVDIEREAGKILKLAA